MSVDFSAPDKGASVDANTIANTQSTEPNGGKSAQDQSVFLEHAGRKYVSKDDVVKKIANADEFIEKLKAEAAAKDALIAQMKASTAPDIAELLAQLKSNKQEPNAPAASQGESLSMDAVVAKVKADLQAAESAKLRANNWVETTKVLQEAFGDKVNEQVAKVASANDMTLEEAAEMIRSKPKVFLKLFTGLKPAPLGSAVHTSTRNTLPTGKTPETKDSGFSKATGKAATEIYLKRLAEFGNG